MYIYIYLCNKLQCIHTHIYIYIYIHICIYICIYNVYIDIYDHMYLYIINASDTMVLGSGILKVHV